MRTRRKSPRVLALLVCIFSAIFFNYATSALARVQSEKQSSVLDSITLGKKTYRLSQSTDSPECLGLVDVKLVQTPAAERSSSLIIDARFFVSNGEDTFPINLNAKSEFDSLGELSEIDINFTLGSIATLRINGPGHSVPLIATLSSLPDSRDNGSSESISLFALERIYLFETTKDTFRLRLPNSLSGLSTHLQTKDNAGRLIEEATEEIANSCRAHLNSTNPYPILTIPLANKNLNKSMIVNLLRSIKQ